MHSEGATGRGLLAFTWKTSHSCPDNERTCYGHAQFSKGLHCDMSVPILCHSGTENLDSGARWPGFKSQLGHSLADSLVQSLINSGPISFPKELTTPTS